MNSHAQTLASINTITVLSANKTVQVWTDTVKPGEVFMHVGGKLHGFREVEIFTQSVDNILDTEEALCCHEAEVHIDDDLVFRYDDFKDFTDALRKARDKLVAPAQVIH